MKYCGERNFVAMEPCFFSSADIKTGTFTVSNTGPGETVNVEIVVRRVKDWSD